MHVGVVEVALHIGGHHFPEASQARSPHYHYNGGGGGGGGRGEGRGEKEGRNGEYWEHNVLYNYLVFL